jgi:hypothetical protein
MMTLKLVLTVVASVGMLASAGTARADSNNAQNKQALAKAPIASSIASCRYARVCAFVDQGGAIVRSKNVISVTRHSTGSYCIYPKPGIVDTSRIIPAVTVEWGRSYGSDLLAFYRDGTYDCPLGSIQVLTYDLKGNRIDRVAFVISVD